MPLQQLFTSRHFTAEHDERRGLLRVTRSAEKLQPSEVSSIFDQMATATAPIDRARTGLLIDMRGGPSNNDPAFERAMREQIERLTSGFRKRAVLVRSAAGVLQVNRLANDVADRSPHGTFRDENEAIAWLVS